MLRRSLPLLLTSALLVGCGGSDDDGDPNTLTVRISSRSVAAGVATDFEEQWVAFTADEATSAPGGLDLNGDGDAIDQVVQFVNLVNGVETNAGIAVADFHWLGGLLYLAVDESQDGTDWDGDTMLDDRVLLLLDPASPGAPSYLTLLRDDGVEDIVRAGEWLFVDRGEGAVMANTSSIWAIHDSAPMTLSQVMTNDATAGLNPRLLGSEDAMVFLELDETRESRDLNGDSDMLDEHVLALLDGTGTLMMGGYEFPLRSTQLAMPSADSALRAMETGANDWQVGFVVDEAGQGSVNLNEPGGMDSGLPASWSPNHCVGFEDADTMDTILHVISFRAWDDMPLVEPPLNTGLIAEDRIVMAPGWVGTISDEAQEGTCDLNGDGDQVDEVFRWTAIATPVLPPGNVNDIFAVDRLPGGLEGVGELDDAWVIAVDEAADQRDLNDDGFLDLAVLQWIDPSVGPPFENDHGSGASSYGAATWMGPSSDDSRLGVAFDELSNDVDLNNDGDTLDSVPSFARFTGSPRRLAFPGYAAAAQKANAGIVFQDGWAFYRISEAEDDTDWNGDGTADDFVLLRSRLSDGLTQYLVELNNLNLPSVRPSMISGARGGVFLVDESMAGDVNGDGVISFAFVYYAI